ncbi:AMP-binding protein [Alkalilimnicola ehrlichii MLHE-1]|uniref:acetate--CoA ligase n=1 Tax=Alkalilimnicola ehrlichii (strain ATCC BAA-1101 / DSM 17681 / MLHE-1) TaxID=187272 RepID=Q0A597_ALKEH|nr:AMP-binding protein [Alkalilimnicola ehrlichii]ABI57990.1 AMP-dependent synthetase and ligase [Alkalilimnicola ehrlichii MLHE-1]
MATEDGFSWAEIRRHWLKGLPDGRLNMAYEALDRHVEAGGGDHEALVWRGLDNERRASSYAELLEASARFAGALRARGVGLGERVCTLAPRRPEPFIAGLGALRQGAVFAPLFPVYGPQPVRQRLTVSEARVLVTTEQLYRETIWPIRAQLPALQDVILLDGEAPDAERWDWFIGQAEPVPPVSTGPEYPALLHFTSGTLGPPKCVLHAHRAAAAHVASGRLVLELSPGSRHWCTADLGWVTGVSYAMLVPLLCGATTLIDEPPFEAQRWYGLLEQERIQSWVTSPTALRLLRRAGTEIADGVDLSALQRLFSTGEPLDAPLTHWSQATFGTPARNGWWQSETGVIMIAQYGDEPVAPGRMGRAVPGIEVALVRHGDDGVTRVPRGEVGEIAVRSGWPSQFLAYLGDTERYRQAFLDGWYLSGDLAKRLPDGELQFLGRSDDVIKTRGYMVGPAEVEAVLNRHPAVAESAVAGVPHRLTHTVVAAWVVPNARPEDPERLRRELLVYARRALGPAVTPRRITLVDELPRTPGGKVLRRALAEGGDAPGAGEDES